MALTASILQGGTNNHTTSSEEVNYVATDFFQAGVVGNISATSGVAPMTGGFAVNAQGSPNMTVAVSAGSCYVTTTPSGGNSQLLRIKNSASANVTITANATGGTRYDWLYVSVDAAKAANPALDASDVATLVTSRSTSNTTDNGTPPTYGTVLAVITVANGASSITNGNIRDNRTQSTVQTSANTSATGWNSLGYTPNTITCNGNRSYSLVFNSTDLTSTISPGMRLRTTRLTQAPTQSTSLNGTTQFWSKTAPAGMTFTNNFVVSGWIKLANYPAVEGIVSSRFNGTSGWEFKVISTGQVYLVGYNAAGANYSQVGSYQSVPLNKWVHVTAQLDMSTFTATPTTSYVMLDGVDVPATVTRGGTNPTALVQAGNLEIGSKNGGTVPLPGKLAQVAVYSAKVTQPTIQASISQGLLGTETSLISAYSFNGVATDLNANANNLTANGSAVATNADSPFGGQASGLINSTLDYGIVQSASFSTNTTVVVQVPEGCTIPTSGGVSAVVYSSNKVPYGFPANKNKWRITSITAQSTLVNYVSTSQWAASQAQLIVPIGEWDRLGYQGPGYLKSTVAGVRGGHFLLAPATPTNAVYTSELTSRAYNAATTGNTDYIVPLNKDTPASLSSATPYIMYSDVTSASGTESFLIAGAESVFTIFAEPATL